MERKLYHAELDQQLAKDTAKTKSSAFARATGEIEGELEVQLATVECMTKPTDTHPQVARGQCAELKREVSCCRVQCLY